MVHAADAADRRRRILLRKVEERQRVAAAHVEKYVRRGRIVAIGYHPRESHLQNFGIEPDGGVEVGTYQRQMIDAAGSHGLTFGPTEV